MPPLNRGAALAGKAAIRVAQRIHPATLKLFISLSSTFTAARFRVALPQHRYIVAPGVSRPRLIQKQRPLTSGVFRIVMEWMETRLPRHGSGTCQTALFGVPDAMRPSGHERSGPGRSGQFQHDETQLILALDLQHDRVAGLHFADKCAESLDAGNRLAIEGNDQIAGKEA